MHKQTISVLTNLGLSEKEAKVFLACIENGTNIVSAIAQSAGINRVTTYDILEKLKQRGLVSFYSKNKIKYFTAIDPEILLEEYEKRTNDLRSVLPKFKALSGEINHPRIRYFEGLEGIKAIYADTLSSKTEILNYSNSHEIRTIWPSYDKDYVEKRAKKKIFLRGISPLDKEGEIVRAENQKYNREIRLVPREEFQFTNEINIYDDKVSIISFRDELIGMIIESIEIANSQRAIFNMCWQLAKMMEEGLHISPTLAKTKLLQPLKESELEKLLKNGQGKVQTKNMSLF